MNFRFVFMGLAIGALLYSLVFAPYRPVPVSTFLRYYEPYLYKGDFVVWYLPELYIFKCG